MRIVNYFRECRQELKRVAWPKKDEVVFSARAVLITTLLAAVFLGAVDFLVSSGANLLFR